MIGDHLVSAKRVKEGGRFRVLRTSYDSCSRFGRSPLQDRDTLKNLHPREYVGTSGSSKVDFGEVLDRLAVSISPHIID